MEKYVQDHCSYRSKERIKDFGEVFTPESCVNQMLDLIGDQKNELWSDEDISFFEPSCGHGNIVIPRVRLKVMQD